MVHLYTDHQTLEPLNKRNQAYQQHSSRLKGWLDRLAFFDISIKHTAEKNLLLTDCLNRHPTEEATTDEIQDEEFLIKTHSELCKLNHKNRQLLNTDRKFRSSDQSSNMTLKANRQSNNEVASPKKFKSDANLKNFARKQAQANS